MKRLNQLFLSCLFALFLFASCQDEEIQITDSDPEATIAANSSLAMAISNTTSLDGSLDNILDGANCLTVGLPVTVTVNGIQIVIDSQDDYAVVEAIFDEFDDDEDSVEIQFPITIILSNYTEITIESYSELETFIEACAGENEYDDDIECIDFVYPFTISVYNANFQVTETVTITSDAMLYAFIESLDGGVLASINFPISMVLANGNEIVVNNNAELEAAINAADDTCDEDDDNDYNDDDNNDIPVNDFIEILTSCTWTVDQLEIDDVDLEDQYVGFVFDFNVNGTVTVQNGNNTVSGTWAMVQVSTGIQISLQINDLPDFNNEHWILHEIEDGNEFKIDFRHGEDRLRFERFECDTQTDCTELDVDGYLQSCVWQIVNLDGSDALIVYQLEFNANQEVVITGNGMTINGGWSTSQSATGGVEVVFSNIAGPSIQAINGSWVIVDCMADRLEMEMGDHHMVMEQDCSASNPLDCFSNTQVEICDNMDPFDDGHAAFDLSNIFSNCLTDDVEVAFYETMIDAETQVNALANPYNNSVAFQQTIYAGVTVIGTGQFEIYEVNLIVNDCSDDLTVDDIVNAVIDGTWMVAQFIDSGANETSVYANYTVNFNVNGTVQATDGGSSTFNGTWSVVIDSNSHLRFILEFNDSPFNEFNDDWFVFSLTNNNRIELHGVANATTPQDKLVFEKL